MEGVDSNTHLDHLASLWPNSVVDGHSGHWRPLPGDRRMERLPAGRDRIAAVQHSASEGAPVFVPGTAEFELHPEKEGRRTAAWKSVVMAGAARLTRGLTGSAAVSAGSQLGCSLAYIQKAHLGIADDAHFCGGRVGEASEMDGGKPVLAAVKLPDVDLEQVHLLDGAERQMAGEFGSTRQRDKFLAGRIALRFHVAEVAGVDPGSLHADYLCRNCRGEDRAHGAPRYRVGANGPWVQASLSRSGDWCLMAAVLNGQVYGVGVDLECSAAANFEGFGDVAMTPREHEYLEKVTASQRSLVQTVLWTRKEAVLKALGRGLSLDPTLVDVAGVVPLLPGWMSGPERWVVEEVHPGPLGLADDGVAAMAVAWNK